MVASTHNAAGHPGGLEGDGADLTSPVSRALHVLDVVAASSRPLRFAELERRIALPKATLHRLLRQLQAERMLQFDSESQRYSMGARTIHLAHAAWESASLVAVAQPVLQRLQADVGHTVHLACLDGGQVLYLSKHADRMMLGSFSRPGRIGPAYCTGVGKAMLAALPADQRAAALRRQTLHPHTPRTIATLPALERALAEVRERGYAVDDEEHEVGVVCVAAAVLSRRGGLLGAVSVSASTSAATLAALLERHGEVAAAAAAVARLAAVQLIDIDAVPAVDGAGR